MQCMYGVANKMIAKVLMDHFDKMPKHQRRPKTTCSRAADRTITTLKHRGNDGTTICAVIAISATKPL